MNQVIPLREHNIANECRCDAVFCRTRVFALTMTYECFSSDADEIKMMILDTSKRQQKQKTLSNNNDCSQFAIICALHKFRLKQERAMKLMTTRIGNFARQHFPISIACRLHFTISTIGFPLHDAL